MNGVLLVDKPEGWTSFDVVAKLRGATRQKKVGHGGTLDPMATGVLPILFGRATRAADLLPDRTKRYRAELLLGVTTDTYDTTGEVTARRAPAVTAEALERAAAAFRGELLQRPPMYSAVKIGGRRLYDIARRGGEVERPARPVTIFSLEAALVGENRVALDVVCSKGTYIRSLCHDLGELLGCGAAMSALCRTASAGFALADCLPLAELLTLAADGAWAARLLPLGAAFSALPRLDVSDHFARLMSSGVRVRAAQIGAPDGGAAAVYHGGDFIGVGEADGSGLFIFKNLAD